ncbi:hypothetical protein SNEBB_006914 [Seison nebaliae]|nr:hypothetical protein SNEBB_006914 [Seison nebaliae]
MMNDNDKSFLFDNEDEEDEEEEDDEDRRIFHPNQQISKPSVDPLKSGINQDHLSKQGPLPDIAVVQSSSVKLDKSEKPSSSPNSGNQLFCNTEATPLLREADCNDLVVELTCNQFPNDPQFRTLIVDAENAINNSIYPQRILQGSSGSYFVKNSNKDIIGVFKPKDEEPYGILNPKWTKWLQKTCCPCFFGRGCLLPNQGYLSEAGASIVDEKLRLNIVPKTRVVKLSAETFNYTPIDRAKSKAKKNITDTFPDLGRRFHRIRLPFKTGSLQTFVKDYQDAATFYRRYDTVNEPSAVNDRFNFLFEKLVCLDYLIRNTDRGHDNWLVKYQKYDFDKEIMSHNSRYSNAEKLSQKSKIIQELNLIEHDNEYYEMNVAAIDNGLAFPFKHPDEWRTYPYHWAWLAQAKNPFSKQIQDLLIHKLEKFEFVQEIIDELFEKFKNDKSFDMIMFERQMSVLRGQVLNLVNALKEGKTPIQLVQMPGVYVDRAKRHWPLSSGDFRGDGSGDFDDPQQRRSRAFQVFVQHFHNRAPFFSWC